VISYVLALVLEYIPKGGFIGRWFNPHPFNHKEHAAILIMSSTAARSAMAAEVIAVQRLWYTKTPNAAVCIFLIFSSQVLGYGIAGLLRKVLVYPTKVLYSSITLAPLHLFQYSTAILRDNMLLTDRSSFSILQICQSCRFWRRSIDRNMIKTTT
jgi:hypothetical protein